MERVLLLQLDGKIPNLALMRLASHHRDLGSDVELRHVRNAEGVRKHLWDNFQRVYASLIFEKTRPVADALMREYPDAVIGGTGWSVGLTLADVGVPDGSVDYTDYPAFQQSLGFTQRGCRLRCPFCVVPTKEGGVRETATIGDIWRGEPWPREVLLLDNDFFGQDHWRDRIEEIREGRFRVSFNQGINVRFITPETAEAVASVDYRDDSMKVKRLYTAWDSRKDESRLFAGLHLLTAAGVKPDHIMVYMLIGYWPGETEEDWLYRQQRLREFGARPYPMPFVRDPLTVGFQRWVVRRMDCRVAWKDYKAANCRPERIVAQVPLPLFPEAC